MESALPTHSGFPILTVKSLRHLPPKPAWTKSILQTARKPVRFPIHFARSFTQIPTVPNDVVKLMSMQTSLIKELAEKGNCVFVGRAADSILEEYNPFKIFVYADEQSKLDRCKQRAEEGENLTDREMLRAMKRIDKARAEFHDIISEYKWGDKEGYDLCINTTGLEIKKVIPALAEYYRKIAS